MGRDLRAGGEKTFWNVDSPGDTVVVELLDEDFARLILTVEDPRGTVDAINAAINRPEG